MGDVSRQSKSKLQLLAMTFAVSSCSPTIPEPGAERPAVAAKASSVEQWNHSSGIIMNRNIVARFPGATFLGEAEFASTIVGGAFNYREVGSEFLLERPKEVFVEGGQYRIHGIRTISYGTYSVERGIVSIDCPDCQRDFLGLGGKRIFFRHQGRLLTAKADGDGSVVELIPEFLKGDALRILFSGAYVEPVRPAGGVIVSEWPGEIFRSDGLYMRLSNRSRRYGTFQFQGDLVCVQGDGMKHQCRQVILMGDGTYTLTDVSDGLSVQVTITPHK